MDGETFEKHWREIGLGLELLADHPKKRKAWRLLAVYEERTDQLVAEVMRTQYGPIVVMRIAVDDGAEKIEQDSKRNFEPLTGDPKQWWVMTTRHGRYRLRADVIIDCLRTGKTKLTF